MTEENTTEEEKLFPPRCRWDGEFLYADITTPEGWGTPAAAPILRDFQTGRIFEGITEFFKRSGKALPIVLERMPFDSRRHVEEMRIRTLVNYNLEYGDEDEEGEKDNVE